MTKHIMLDLKTMGSGSHAAIVAIGAVVFSPSSSEIESNEFYAVVDLNSSAHYGNLDASTVQWWLQQDHEARAIFNDEQQKDTLEFALQKLNHWLQKIGSKKEIQIWGNGSGFDNVILTNAFKACGITPHFSHWNDRDVRTIVEMGRVILNIDPKKTMTREGVHHSALDDAKFQARYVSDIWTLFEAVSLH